MVRTLEIQRFHLWQKLKDKRAVVDFQMEITARCNNNCRHCCINLPANDSAAMAKELRPEEISRIADQAVSLGATWCLITGGEPLLRGDFPEIYLALKRKGLLVSVFTNGTLIREEHVALFTKYPPRDIEITVYGVTEGTYESVTRQPQSFSAFMRGLNRILESGIPVRLKAMALRSNVRELSAIQKFCRERTKDFSRSDPMLHLRFDRDPARNREIRSERLCPEEIAAMDRADAERFDSLQKKCGSPVQGDGDAADSKSNILVSCGAGTSAFSVSYDGQFRLCSSLWAPGTIYDLRQGALREAWEKHVPKVREIRSDRAVHLENCLRCGLADLCSWCPAYADLETGEMDAPVDYFCDVARARAEQLRGSRGE